MAFDYKKEYKEFYCHKNKPSIVEVPKMNYIAVRGKGNPNDENGEYKQTIGLLYGIDGIDYDKKEHFNFISLIRLPDFVTKKDFDWAIQEATKKKKQDFSKVEFLTYDEGICVQCMHIGSYDDEPATIKLMHEYAKLNGYQLDITPTRYHHEIYLSDPRRCDTSRLKTVIRHPVKKIYL